MGLHSLCIPCWRKHFVDGKPMHARLIPAQPAKGITVPCCRCGHMTASGIRHRIDELTCERHHERYDYENCNPLMITIPDPAPVSEKPRVEIEEKNEVLRLKESGTSPRDIATQLNIKLPRVYYILSTSPLLNAVNS